MPVTTPHRARDTLGPTEATLFERIPADKSAALVAQLGGTPAPGWFDSNDPVVPIVTAIQAALGVESYPPLDREMRIMLTLHRERGVWEPKRVLAEARRMADAIKPPAPPPLATPAVDEKAVK